MLNVSIADTHSAVDVLADADPAVLEQSDLEALLRRISVVSAFVESSRIQITRRLSELSGQGRSVPVESSLINAGQASSQDAQAATARERACSFLPSFERALAAGQVAVGHLDVLATAIRQLRNDNEALAQVRDQQADLLAIACEVSVDEFRKRLSVAIRTIRAGINAQSEVEELERQVCQSAVRRYIDKITGLGTTSIVLDPVRYHQIWARIDTKVASIRQDHCHSNLTYLQLQAEAITQLICADGGTGNQVPEIRVLISHDTLIGQPGARHQQQPTPATATPTTSTVTPTVPAATVPATEHPAAVTAVCETIDGVPLPVATVRRMCCQADIIPIVLASTGEVLDVGRSVRVATKPQRRALAAMYNTCAHPDCQTQFTHCRIHHIIAWEHHGPTNLNNLIPLCHTHHHLVHEGQWTLTMTPNRTTTWTQPNQTHHHTQQHLNRTNEPSQASPSISHHQQTPHRHRPSTTKTTNRSISPQPHTATHLSLF